MNSLPAYEDSEWLDKITEDLNEELTELQSLRKSLLQEQSAVLDEFEGVQQLKNLKSDDIFGCPRMEEGIKAINQILQKTFNVTVDLTQFIKKFVGDLTGCFSGFVLTQPVCVTQSIWQFSVEISKIVPTFNAYELDVTKLAKEIREIYNECTQ